MSLNKIVTEASLEMYLVYKHTVLEALLLHKHLVVMVVVVVHGCWHHKDFVHGL